MAQSTIAQMQDDIKGFMDADIPSFIWGDPGIGKTQGVEQMFISMGYKILFLDISTLEAIDLRGLPAIDIEAEIVKWIPPDMLPNRKRDGKKVLVFMDELNVGHPSIQAATMPFVREKRIGTWACIRHDSTNTSASICASTTSIRGENTEGRSSRLHPHRPT